MKLIDADAFFAEFPELRDYEYASQEYEIDAIPIEWIRNYVSIWISEPYKNFVLNMIKIWEKENERP